MADRQPPPPSALERFTASMAIDYEQWHDGIGYDLAAIDAASPQERVAIERLLLPRAASDWRDVEALARLGTPAAATALRGALAAGDASIRAAVLREAPQLVDDAARTRVLVELVRTADFYSGLSQTLDQVAAFHPQPVIDALWEGLQARDGAVGVHFAAMLTYVSGHATEPFDMDQRDRFLQFNTPDARTRARLVQALRERLTQPPPIAG